MPTERSLKHSFNDLRLDLSLLFLIKENSKYAELNLKRNTQAKYEKKKDPNHFTFYF